MAVRVLRLMEYVYDNLEQAHKDMGNWVVQGTFHPSRGYAFPVITSTVILNPTSFEVVQIKEEISGVAKQP